MAIESIKLSPKKNGKGYVSSYSVSISNKEIHSCGMAGKRIIKIIDKNCSEIVIKAKEFTLTIDILKKIADLKELEKEESNHIDSVYFKNSFKNGKIITMQEALTLFVDEHSGKIKRPAYKKLEAYLLSLTMENIVDLALLMYLGRDMDCDMNMNPGVERFVDFFDRYDDVVIGRSKEELIDIILEKTPLLMYLRMGYRLLTAPKGASIDLYSYDWDEL